MDDDSSKKTPRFLKLHLAIVLIVCGLVLAYGVFVDPEVFTGFA